jgi:hypothetical protein
MLCSRVLRRVCGPRMLAADAASIGCPVDRVLTAARASRTLAGLDAHRPPQYRAAACPAHRLPSAFRAGSHPAMRAAFSVAVVRFEAGRLVAPQGGFLRFASSAADLTPVRCRFRLRSRHHRAAGAAPALGPRLDGPGSPGAAATRLGAGAPSRQHRRRPGLPAVMPRRLESAEALRQPPLLIDMQDAAPVQPPVNSNPNEYTEHGDCHH